jgi:hypothetical protein
MSDEQLPVAQESSAAALMRIIDRAANDPQLDVAKLQALLEVRERWEAAEARRAFVRALNAFKADPPRILKNKQVSFTGTSYRHATLDQVCDQIGEALARHGLSHRWDVTQTENLIRVACVLTHEMGHSERVQLEGMPDDSGKKNRIQQIGSTVTYLQRYTLLSITGLATTDQDDDGRGGESLQEYERPDPWTDALRMAGGAAANRGIKHYQDWWKEQAAEFRRAASATQQHAEFKTLAQQVAS